MAQPPETMEIIILRQGGVKNAFDQSVEQAHGFRFTLKPGEQPTALDVLIRAKEEAFPDLAFRYGCRNRKCGLCTLEINGKPRLACKAIVNNGDRLGPLKGLPVIRDLVVDRTGIDNQLAGRVEGRHQANPWVPILPGGTFVSLTRCIACYACLKGCPLQEMNLRAYQKSRDVETSTGTSVYEFGNPYTFLRLRRIVEDNERDHTIREQALSAARSLGLETCRGCLRCRCQIGIPLIGEVIEPLLKDVEGLRSRREATPRDSKEAEP